MNHISFYLKQADFFGQPIRLKFGEKERFKTEIGGILTCIILAISLALMLQMGQNLIYHQKPGVNFMTLYKEIPTTLNLNPKSMMMAFSFSKFGNQFYSDKHFTLKIQYFTLNRTGQYRWYYTDLPIENCTLHFDEWNIAGNFTSAFYENSLKDAKCFKDYNLSVGGLYTSDYFQEIKVSFLKCVNSTSNNNSCASPQEINSVISGAYLEMYYIDNYIDNSNFTNPLINYFNSFFILLDPSSSKFVDTYIETATVSTDQGWLFTSIKDETVMKFDYFRDQVNVYQSSQTNVVAALYIQSSRNYIVVNRIYMKVQDLAATVGGILKIFLMGGLLISKFFNEVKMVEEIINTLYNFDIEGDNEFIVKKHEINNHSHTNIPNSNSITNKNKKILDFLGVSDYEKKMTFNRLKSGNDDGASNISDISNERNINLNNASNDKNAKNNLRPIKANEQTPNIEFLNIKNDNKPNPVNTKLQLLDDKKLIDEGFEVLKKGIFQKIEEKNYNKEKELRFSYADIFGMFFCHCNSTYKRMDKLLHKSHKEMSKYMNFLDIIKLLQEFHKLKIVLLNDDQFKLFGATSKPIITDGETIDTIHNRYEQKNTKLSVEKLYDSYYLISKNSGNPMNAKLLELFDEEMKVAFDYLVKQNK